MPRPGTRSRCWATKAAAGGRRHLFTLPTLFTSTPSSYALMYACRRRLLLKAPPSHCRRRGIWTAKARDLVIVAKLASYTNPTSPPRRPAMGLYPGQRLVSGQRASRATAPGSWARGFEAPCRRPGGGMTALPAVKAGSGSYSYTWFEQALDPRRCPGIRMPPNSS